MKNILTIVAFLLVAFQGMTQTLVNIPDFSGSYPELDKITLTREELKDPGIILQLEDSKKVDKAEVMGVPAFKEWPLSTIQPTGGIRYDVVDPQVSPDNTLEIKLFKDGKEITYKIKVVAADSGNKKDCDFQLVLPNAGNCETLKEFNNCFGESIDLYDDKTVTYIYDFNSKEPSKRGFYKVYIKDKALTAELVNFNKESLCPKSNVRFKIVNLNRFMYNASIGGQTIDYDSEPNELLSNMLFGNGDLFTSLMSAFSTNLETQDSKSTMVKLLSSLQKKIQCFLTNYYKLEEIALDAYDPCATFPCCYSVGYAQIAKQLMEVKADASSLQLMLEEKKKIAKDNQKIVDDYEKNSKEHEKNKKDNDDALKVAEALPEDTDAKKAAKVAKKQELEKAKLALDKITDAYKTALSLLETTKTELLELSAIDNLSAKLPSEVTLKKLVVFLRNKVSYNQIETLDYIPLDGNVLALDISIVSKDSFTTFFDLPEHKREPIHIEIPILWKPFISFSSGSFIALEKSMLDKTYAWLQNPSTNNYTLVERGNTELPMGFAALGNVEWKVGRNFGFGPSFGVGLTIEKDPRLAYLAGASIFLGDLRQFALTFGWAAMNVDHLTTDFETLVQNQTVYTTTPPTVEYDKKLRVGTFISLSYTPFSLKSKKEKAAEAAEKKKESDKKAEVDKPATTEPKNTAK